MNERLTLQAQIVLGALTAVFMGYILGLAHVTGEAPLTITPIQPEPLANPTQFVIATATTPVHISSSPLPLATPTLGPFVTLSGVWLADIDLYPNAPPKVNRVVSLPSGRLSTFSPGENVLQVLDSGRRVLYEQTFHVSFLLGEPPRAAEKVNLLLILPHLQAESQLKFITPFGEAIYDYPKP